MARAARLCRGLPGQPPGGYGDGGHGLGGRAFGGRDGSTGTGNVVAAGQITAIGTSTLTLPTPQGGTATVRVTSSTSIGGKSGGDLSSLKVGQVVLVAGTRTGDGTYTATAIVTPPTGPDGMGPGSAERGQAEQAPGQSQVPGQNGGAAGSTGSQSET